MLNLSNYSKNFWNKLQASLVIECEKPHEFGIRHKGSSGYISEEILKEFLKKVFPLVNFDMGVVIKTAREENGNFPRILNFDFSDKKLSPQSDIICYIGKPYREMHGIVVVPARNVLVVIEVKKWISQTQLNTFFETRVDQMLDFLEPQRKNFLFIAFRFDVADVLLQEYVNNENLPVPCFFFSNNNKTPYPDYIDVEKYLIEDQLYALITTLKNILDQ